MSKLTQTVTQYRLANLLSNLTMQLPAFNDKSFVAEQDDKRAYEGLELMLQKRYTIRYQRQCYICAGFRSYITRK
jgi:hypothetical protein